MKRLKKICAILSVLGVLSCSYRVPNFEFCAELSNGKGFCKESNTGKERIISKREYQKIRKLMLGIDPADLGKILKFIEKVCAESQKCVYEELEEFIKKTTTR